MVYTWRASVGCNAAAPHLGQIPQTNPFGAWISIFKPNSLNINTCVGHYRNYLIDSNQHQTLIVGGSNTFTTNTWGGWPPFSKIEKSPYLSNSLTYCHELCKMAHTDDRLKRTHSQKFEFLKPQDDRRPPFWQTVKLPFNGNGSSPMDRHKIWYDDACWPS